MRIAGVVLAAFLAGCQGAAPATLPQATATTGTPTSTAAPTPAASTQTTAIVESPAPPTPTARPSGGLGPDMFAFVVTDDLRVRTKPGVSDDSIKLEPLLWDGALVFVIDGPVVASGYDWFLVAPMGEADLQYHPDPPEPGWVAAAGKDGEAWLAPADFTCEGTPWDTLSELEWPPPGLVGLACYGDTPLQFNAIVNPYSIVCDPPSGLEPAWLDQCRAEFALIDPAREEGDPRFLVPVFEPIVPVEGLRVGDTGVLPVANVTGQYDHPAARSCWLDPGPATGFQVPSPELVVLGCRAKFVVTSISIPDVDEGISGE